VVTAPNSYVIYHGPSELDGSPIVAIATGFRTLSVNKQLGTQFIQIWILCADLHPLDAILSGVDVAICGTCSLRGIATPKRVENRDCYVHVGCAPYNIWRPWNRERPASLSTRRIKALFANRGVRLGAYGDPVAVPPRIWRAVMAKAAFWTGYTHQWRDCHINFQRWCMASCDTEHERAEAIALGWRTFRTTRLNSFDDRLAGEIVCPKSKEAGYKSSCERCRLCSGRHGHGQTDVVITLHRFGQ
jgi:hypothetical protein